MKKLILMSLAAIGALSANAVVIGGINYTLDDSAKTAIVSTAENPYGAPYSGDIVIPETVSYNGTDYTVTSVAMSAFESSKVTSVVLPNTVEKVNLYAFYGAKELKSITFGTGAWDLKNTLVDGCTALTDIYINYPTPFYNSNKVFTSAIRQNVNLHLPSKEWIKKATGDATLGYWTGYKMYLSPSEACVNDLYFELYPETKTAMMIATFEAGKFFGIEQSALSGEAQKIGPDVEVPGTIEIDGEEYTVTNLQAGAFYETPNVTSVKFNEGLTNIEYETFYGTKVTEVVFPNSLENLAYGNFYYCRSVKEVTFGTGFKTIGADCFNTCPAMTDITVLATVPPTKDPQSPAGDVFSSAFKQQVVLHVPEGSADAYKASPIWGGFKQYVEIPNPNVGVEGIEAADVAPARFFNLQGVEISEPVKGEIVIEMRGGKSIKRVVR